ncbi:hypothetical protein ACIPY6_34320 [Streptomyces sp. NPDC090054]|uniref:hypothetical protein n=1 Tax=Streptomyces sp. NPDC090054 TaxID=3365933 RepID=UPI0037FBDF03
MVSERKELYNMYESHIPWKSAVEREEKRQAWQRTGSANRRAAAINRGVEKLGSQQAVAHDLGVSPAAVSKALGQARHRTAGEVPMADFLELDLPRTAERVPTLEEWRALPTDRQPAAAEAAAFQWGAIATATQRLADQVKDAGAYLYEQWRCGPDEEGDEEPVPALVRTDDLSIDPLPLMNVYFDLAETLRARTLEAIGSEKFWSSLANPAPGSD